MARLSRLLPLLSFALCLTPSRVASAGVCEDSGVLTLLATDSNESEFLFAMDTDGDELGGWLLRVAASPPRATLYPDALKGSRVGGSTGPGPFLAAHGCGETCLQPLSWTGDGWSPLGPAVEVGAAGSVHFARDRSGAPWLTNHRATEVAEVVSVDAWRLEDGVWHPKGHLRVQAVGTPAARPDRDGRSSILVGTGRFRADEPPEYWLSALPALPSTSGAQLHQRAGSALYLTADSRIFTSTDAGGTWRRERWAPWPTERRGVTLWEAGRDYWTDSVLSLSWSSFPLLWFDDRDRSTPELVLSRRSDDGTWRSEAKLPRGANAAFPIEHIFELPPDRWLLLGPCSEGAGGRESSLPALEVDSDGIREFRIPLVAGWER